MHVTVLTWNIWKGKYLDEAISYLKDANADIIGLQEVMEMETENSARKIAEALGYSYYYQKAFRTDRHTPSFDMGNAILSRYPLLNSAVTFLSDSESYQGTAESEPRNAVTTDIVINNKTLHIINTHIGYTKWMKPSVLRGKQIKKLLDIIPKQNGILMGDFNSDITGTELSPIRNTIQSADPDPTSPSWSVYPHTRGDFMVKGLEYRIDNIFVTKDIHVVETHLGDTKASDHLPVISTIEI